MKQYKNYLMDMDGVLVRGATADARAFYAFLRQPAARRTLVRFGFTLPDSGAR